MVEDAEEEEDETKRDDNENEDDNNDDNIQKYTELPEEEIPLPVDEDVHRSDADEKAINELIAEHDCSESMSFD